MPRKRKDVEAALRSKGFVKIEGDHHYFVYLTKDGRKSRARTKTSHSPKVRDVADGLLGQMARQCLLSKAEFLDLVDCPMNRDEYEALLIARGEIEPST
ncbi:MAG: hypothetical protein BGO49_11695 [Planctomycetales bacterium 71-10]|nr:MAG: hypothetical protein BGO49_11695 [Planctomycetales bacterium 71-10]